MYLVKTKKIPILTKKQLAGALSQVEIKPNNGCWEWTGIYVGGGYGRITLNRGKYLTHRVFYNYFVGFKDDGLTIDHTCKNTKCVNPGHLREVSIQENMRSMTHANTKKTSCVRGHFLGGYNLRLCRDKSGKVFRQCRECGNIRKRKHRLKKMEEKCQSTFQQAH